jgi:hypothetical protein
MANESDNVKFDFWDLHVGDVVKIIPTNELAVITNTNDGKLTLFNFIEVYIFKKKVHQEILKEYIEVISPL